MCFIFIRQLFHLVVFDYYSVMWLISHKKRMDDSPYPARPDSSRQNLAALQGLCSSCVHSPNVVQCSETSTTQKLVVLISLLSLEEFVYFLCFLVSYCTLYCILRPQTEYEKSVHIEKTVLKVGDLCWGMSCYVGKVYK